MSFFTGLVAGKPLIHITKGSTALGTIKGPPTTNTVLHSDANYTGYRIFEPPVSDYAAFNYKEDSGNYSAVIHTKDSAEIRSFKNYVLGNGSSPRRTFLVFINDVVQTNRAVSVDASFGGLLTSGAIAYLEGGILAYDITGATTSFLLQSKVSIQSIYFVAFDVNVLGTDTLPSFNFINKQVRISKNSFSIGGVELSSVPFLTFGDLINNEDKHGRINGDFQVQFVNSSPTNSGGYKVDVNKGRCLIQKGTKTIIDTNKNFAVSTLQATQSIVRHYPPRFYGQSTIDIGYLSSEGVYVFTGYRRLTSGLPEIIAASTLGVVKSSLSDVVLPLMGLDFRVARNDRKVTLKNTGHDSSWYEGDKYFGLVATKIFNV